MTLGGVLEDHDALGLVAVDGQVKVSVENDRSAVGPVQLGHLGTALDMVSVITVHDRKMTHWDDYLDPLAGFDAVGWPHHK